MACYIKHHATIGKSGRIVDGCRREGYTRVAPYRDRLAKCLYSVEDGCFRNSFNADSPVIDADPVSLRIVVL